MIVEQIWNGNSIVTDTVVFYLMPSDTVQMTDQGEYLTL